MADERDPNNPIDAMMPPADNPEYHRKLAEHKERLQGDAKAAILSDPAHAAIGERLASVRQGAPQAAAPQPLAQDERPPLAPPAYPEERTGLTVDPTVGQVAHTPIEPRLPEGAVAPAAPAIPAAAVVPVAPAAPAETSSVGKTSPILQKLREDFGIDKIPLEEVKINGHVFSMHVLDIGAITQALRFADTLSLPGSDRENAINLQIALTSFSVVAIDGTPVWQVFDVNLPDTQLVLVEGQKRPIFSPMSPPSDIRVLGATHMMDFLSGQASSMLLAELWKQYTDKVDPKGSLEILMASIMDDVVEEPSLPLP